MYDRLGSRAEFARQKVGVQVAAQQQQLKEKHAGGPNRGRSAKPRQDVFAQYQLYLEKKECSAKDG